MAMSKGMTSRLQSQSYFQLVQAVGLGAGLLFAGCHDPKPRTSERTPEPRPQFSASEDAPMTQAARDPGQTKAPAAPSPPAAENPEATDPQAIAKEFRATAEPDRRGELVETLWSLDTPAAVETLRHLFLTERELDVKIDIVAGLSDSNKPETRNARFGLVVMALAQGQPKDVRELAAQMLVDFDDPRAISLLQQYAQDVDPDMREAAQEALETRRAVEEP